MYHEEVAGRPEQEVLNALEGVNYCIDFAGTILAVGRPHWDEFAAANGAGPSLSSSLMAGKNLFDFIDGEDVAASYRRILDDLQSGRERQISFTFRCDAPDVMREMRMCISCVRHAGEPEAALFQSLVLDERQRPPVSLFDVARLKELWASHNDLPLVSICSYCHNVRWPAQGDAWITPEEYYAKGGHGRVRLSHGICPTCYANKIVRRDESFADP